MSKIWIITWGDNSEREISLRSAEAVTKALKSLGYTVEVFDFPDDKQQFLKTHKEITFCRVLIHGTGGEDGTVSSRLDELGIPYQGCSATTHATCIDKVRTKEIRKENLLPVANDLVFSLADTDKETFAASLSDFGLPCVCKAPTEGSTRGMYFCFTPADIPLAYEALQSYETILVEEYVTGREFTVAVLEQDSQPVALPVVEIIPPENELFDYANKYNGKTQEVCPAQVDSVTTKHLQQLALDAYKAVNCSSYARVDLLVGKEWPVLLEINTIPGFTSESLYPQAALAAGISFEELLEVMMQASLDKST